MINNFSIILPVRNGGEYVKECVNSILSQTLQNFNLIVLDNCSNDDTYEWIKNLNDNRIVIYRSDVSLSISENWGRIKDVDKNEFITIIGHDDLLHPQYLQTMDELISKHPNASLYQAHYKFIDGSGSDKGVCLPMDEVQYAHEFIAAHFARTMNSMGTGYMMRSKDYDDAGGIPIDYPNLIFADYILWINLIAKGYKATTLQQCFSYRIHNNISKLTDAVSYQIAFEKYVLFIHEKAGQDDKIKSIVEMYGKEMLLFFCESLSHRLLKMPKKKRQIKVNNFIETCKKLAGILIPGQEFEPLKVFKIRIAKKLDANTFTRILFQTYKKLQYKSLKRF